MRHEEALTQWAVVTWLRRHGIFCFAIPNEGPGFSARRQLTMASTGLTAGVADLEVWWPDGTGYIEMKSRKGRQTEAQVSFEHLCRSTGREYRIIRSLDEAIELATWHGINPEDDWGRDLKAQIREALGDD